MECYKQKGKLKEKNKVYTSHPSNQVWANKVKKAKALSTTHFVKFDGFKEGNPLGNIYQIADIRGNSPCDYLIQTKGYVAIIVPSVDLNYDDLAIPENNKTGYANESVEDRLYRKYKISIDSSKTQHKNMALMVPIEKLEFIADDELENLKNIEDYLETIPQNIQFYKNYSSLSLEELNKGLLHDEDLNDQDSISFRELKENPSLYDALHFAETKENTYPYEITLLSSSLLREKYIKSVSKNIDPKWKNLSDNELTELIKKDLEKGKISIKELKEKYFKWSKKRTNQKNRFRAYTFLVAIVGGLIWARENIKNEEWDEVLKKVAVPALNSYIFNKLLYKRDLSAKEILKKKGNDFGRWFNGIARANEGWNNTIRIVGKGAKMLTIFTYYDILTSSGGEGPSTVIFDLIRYIDIDNPATWTEPEQFLLDLGFSIWYAQEPNKKFPSSVLTYWGVIHGNFFRPEIELIKKLKPIIQSLKHYQTFDQLKNNLFYLTGDWDVTPLLIADLVGKKIKKEDNIIVAATGRTRIDTTSRGHLPKYEVVALSSEAIKLFNEEPVRWIATTQLEKIDLKSDVKYDFAKK